MIATKSPFASKTVWAGIITAVAGVVGLLGYSMEAADIDALSQAAADLVDLSSRLISIVGAVAAIGFRLTATKRLG
jgi:hypothetical protein